MLATQPGQTCTAADIAVAPRIATERQPPRPEERLRALPRKREAMSAVGELIHAGILPRRAIPSNPVSVTMPVIICPSTERSWRDNVLVAPHTSAGRRLSPSSGFQSVFGSMRPTCRSHRDRDVAAPRPLAL